MRIVATSLLALLATNISFAAGICADSDPLEKCLKQEVSRADARLNASYKSVLVELDRATKDNPGAKGAKAKLVLAQRAWIQYRDNDCDAVYELHIEGSLRGVLYLECIIDHTNSRTDKLNALMSF